jgi:hypothetical protein
VDGEASPFVFEELPAAERIVEIAAEHGIEIPPAYPK